MSYTLTRADLDRVIQAGPAVSIVLPDREDAGWNSVTGMKVKGMSTGYVFEKARGGPGNNSTIHLTITGSKDTVQ